MEERSKFCAICDDPASIFCPMDDAFLCDACDEEVHEANLLARRHSRVGADSIGDPCLRVNGEPKETGVVSAQIPYAAVVTGGSNSSVCRSSPPPKSPSLLLSHGRGLQGRWRSCVLVGINGG